MRRAIAIATTVVLVAAPIRAADEGKPGHIVVRSEKRTVEGKITVNGNTVTVEGRYGSVDFPKDEVDIFYDPVGGGGNPGAATNGAKRWVEVEKKEGGGTPVQGEVVDEKPDSITIKPRSGSAQTFKLADYKVTTIDEPSAVAAEVDLGDRWVDEEARFQLERPGPEWKLRKSVSPETRASMTLLPAKDATLTVSVKPVSGTANPAYTDTTKETSKKAQPEIEADLKAELEKYAGLNVDMGELFGVPVVEARYEGNFVNDPTVYQFIENRFTSKDKELVYSVRVYAEKKNTFKDLEPKLREALTSFSFIPPQGGGDDYYNDLIKGFGITRPGTKWTIDAHPFDEKEPVVIHFEGDRAQIRVVCDDAASNGNSASTYLDTYLANCQKKAQFTQIEAKKPGKKGDSYTYHCSYYEKGAARGTDDQGLVALADTRIIHVIGVAPTADNDARELQKEVAKALDALKLFDPKRKHLADGAEAVKSYTAGVQAEIKKEWANAISSFDAALKLFPDYAQAYLERAKCNAKQKSWKTYREDLKNLLELDPRPETVLRCAPIYAEEATTRAKEKDFKEAFLAWRDAVKADPKDDKLRKDFISFYKDWWAELKKQNPGAKSDKALEEIDSHRWNDKDFNVVLATFYVDAGQTLLQADKHNYGKAHNLATRVLNELDKNSKDAAKLKKDAEDVEKALAKTPPKK
jgi:hypothetical protein